MGSVLLAKLFNKTRLCQFDSAASQDSNDSAELDHGGGNGQAGGVELRRTRRGMAVLSLPRIVIPKSPNLSLQEFPLRHR